MPIVLTAIVAAATSAAAFAAAPQAGPRPDYVADQACLACHEAQAGPWADSKHAKAMAPATPATVLGDFDDARFTRPGEETRFVRRGDLFLVVTRDASGKQTEFPAEYTFGVRPLQQMLLPLPGGRLQAFTVAWDTERHRWFDLSPDGSAAPGDALHWQGRYQNWNLMCGECHTTAYRKGYDDENDRYRTTWGEPRVGCQACHGGGRAHVESARAMAAGAQHDSPATKPLATPNRSLYAATAGGPGQADQCAACHARRTRLVEQSTPGNPLLDDFIPDALQAGDYHVDGQQLAEVFEYGAFRQSRMYQAGVACTDCHDPHGGKLRAAGNALCVRCHNAAPDNTRFPGLQAKDYDAPEHHFHAPDSQASQCVNCHMPSSNYMVVHARRDHAIRIPRPDLSARLGTPNACTACHADRPAAWAAAAITDHHGSHPRPRHYGEVLAAARRGDPEAPTLLQALINDADQPAIVRATALDLWARNGLGPVPDSALADPDPIVRRAAAAVLSTRPEAERLARLPALLADPLRGVRITAVRGLADLADSRLDPASIAARRTAMAELISAQQAMADMPATQLNLAAIAQAQRDLPTAERHYRRALDRDPALQPGRLALAALLAASDRVGEAINVLRAGLSQSTAPGPLHLALGLLAGKRVDWQTAVTELRAAARLMPENKQVPRNLSAVEDYLARRSAPRGE
ncbi:MAG: hypothetical protein KDH20_16130 [Rhodocyclaceae bacterium]|nr:hypothetical protein [Rhodocyclaceae bacterium]